MTVEDEIDEFLQKEKKLQAEIQEASQNLDKLIEALRKLQEEHAEKLLSQGCVKIWTEVISADLEIPHHEEGWSVVYTQDLAFLKKINYILETQGATIEREYFDVHGPIVPTQDLHCVWYGYDIEPDECRNAFIRNWML